MRCRGRLLQIVWLSSLLVASIALDNDPDDEDVAAEEEDDEEDEFGGGDGGGFCPDSLFPKLTLLRHVTPRGNASAGRFTKVAHASSLMDCTKACCEQGPLCNLVFLHGSSCFLVRCRSAALCQPQRRPSTKFDSSFMVIVRPPQKGSSDSSHEWSSHSGPNSNEDTLPSLHGWKNTKGNGDSSEEALNSSSILVPANQVVVGDTGRTCVYGIVQQCLKNEECVTSGPRRRTGTCRCRQGFTKDPVSGSCTGPQNASLSSQAVPTAAPLSSSSTKAAAAASPTTTTPYPLIVSAGENKELHLPENEVVLSAYALKGGGDGNKFQYQWTLVSHPDGEETGVMQDQNTQALKLSHLREGLYTFRVAVTGNNSYGEATTNVTVLPPKRINKPPVAIIQPDNVTVKLPSKDTVLDGSFSTDDDKIVQYHWEPITIPIGYSPKLNDTPTVQLKDLIPGFYQFMLKVTDSDGVTNTTSANVTVLKEMDYPPTANAGPQSVVYMPNNEVTLNGNLSTDDKGIKSWEWTKSPDTDKHVDMEGTTSPYLHLSNMEVGVYKFLLKVTDTADQTATAEVHVFVKPASNQAPTANAGKDMRVSLPIDKPIMLDGSHSTDDVGITSWHWSQIQGPKPSRIEEPNSSTTRVSNLVPGEYVFKLDVVDANNLTSSDNVSIIITQNKNAPPKADAGGDRTVFLPVDVVSLNGSRSSDDVEIVSWHWTREPSSLAAGHILENSSFSPILRLSELIPGRYMFTLTVSDAQGATGQDTASLIVKPMPSLVQQVELLLDVDIETFTQEQLDTVLKQLELLLHDGESLRVHLVDLNYQQDSRRVRIIFVAEKEDAKGSWLPCRGPLMVARLKQRLRTHSALLDWDVISVDTVVCQNECSGHGTCDMYSKRCVCEAFWMEDFVRASLGDRESNCDWSVLYVIIIAFLLLSVLSTSLWGLACFCSRMHFRRPRIKRNYTLLKDSRDIEKDSLDLIPKGKTLTTSLMASDSDSDTLFETRPRPSVAVKPLTGNHRTGTSNGSLKNRVHT
ncbi:dyslexia-associated protein KIAA0319-like protein isoform X2 [Rhipicephalus microplus]|uniref:dyslexia-associated protein KIAA0319-like protein isoform X2 n=1 Tax=Rhipicephalus microplus TaxID=6941 RepID=UPI003F6AFAAB